MMDIGHLKDISQEMLIMIPKWLPCFEQYALLGI